MAGSHRKPSLASVFGKLPSAQFPTAAPGRRGVPALHEPDGRERCRSAAAPLHGDHSDFQGKTESLPQANPFRSTFSRGSYGTERSCRGRPLPRPFIQRRPPACREVVYVYRVAFQQAAPTPPARCTRAHACPPKMAGGIRRVHDFGRQWTSGTGCLSEVLTGSPEIVIRRQVRIGDDEWRTSFSGFSSEVELRDVLKQCKPESRRFAERISRDASCLAYFFVRVEFTGNEVDAGRMTEQVLDVARSFLASRARTTPSDVEVVAHNVSFPNSLDASSQGTAFARLFPAAAVPRTLVVRIYSPTYYTVGADELAWFAMRLKGYVTQCASTLSKCVLDAFVESCSADADGGGVYGSIDFAPCIPLPESRYDPKVERAGVAVQGVNFPSPARDLLCAPRGAPPATWVRLPAPPQPFLAEREAAKCRRTADDEEASAFPVDDHYEPLMVPFPTGADRGARVFSDDEDDMAASHVLKPRVTPIVYPAGVKTIVDSSVCGAGKTHQVRGCAPYEPRLSGH